MARLAERKPVEETQRTESPYESVDECRSKGKALRDAVPRASHGGWKPPKDRRDPIELLLESFHPTPEMVAGFESGYTDAIAAYRESLPEHVQTLFNRFHFFDLAIKVVGVGASAPSVPSPCSWPRMTTSCSSR